MIAVFEEADSIRTAINDKIFNVHAVQAEAAEHVAAAREALTSVAAAARVKKIKELHESAVHKSDMTKKDMEKLLEQEEKAEALQVAVAQIRKEQAERERKQREAEAHKRLVAQEKKRVKAIYADVKALVPSYHFDQAVARLQTAHDNLKTDEAKEDMDVYLGRMKWLADMKKKLITKLDKEPYRWGWGPPGNARDVTGADKDNVYVAKRPVAWPDVSLTQFLRFMNHYAELPDTPLPEQGWWALSEAILLNENGKKAEARESAARAVSLAVSVKDDAERLVPELL